MPRMTYEQMLEAKRLDLANFEAKLAEKETARKEAGKEKLAALEARRSEKQDQHIEKINALNETFKAADDKIVLQIMELRNTLGLKADDNETASV
jgi:hypothetical protein